jgi:hypothetical protein
MSLTILSGPASFEKVGLLIIKIFYSVNKLSRASGIVLLLLDSLVWTPIGLQFNI